MKTILTTVFLSVIISFSAQSQDRYWVGGTGSWKDPMHWSTTSGGTGPASLPTDTTNVFIDASSGLVLNDTIYLDTIVLGRNFNFLGLSDSIVFSSTLPTIQIYGDITASGNGKFDWTNGTFSMLDTAELSITSNGQEWNMNYVFQNVVDTVTLNDNFNSTANITSSAEKFKANNIQINAQNIDIQGTASIEWTNTNTILSGNLWNSSTTSTISVSGKITTTTSTPYTFNSGNITNSFDTLLITDVATFPVGGMFNHIKFDGDSITIGNGSALKVDSLVATNGSCANRARVSTVNLAGASASISRITSGDFSSSNVEVENIHAVQLGTEDYFLSSGDTTNALGWKLVGKTYYWIGNTGNWSDTTNWSESSGGPSTSCFPGRPDTVIFDVNSFSTSGQTVTVDTVFEYGRMQWITGGMAPNLVIDTVLFGYGETILESNLNLSGAARSSRLQLSGNFDLYTNTTLFDVNLMIDNENELDSIKLQDNLTMTDSSSLYLISGNLITNSNNIVTGTIQVLNSLTSNNKHLNLGASQVNLFAGFRSDSLFTLDAGTSHIFIDSSKYPKYLSTEGLTFYDVTLEMNYVNDSIINTDNVLKGNNNYNNLTILPSSVIVIDSTVTQTVNGTLSMIGNCRDSISLSSSNPTITSIFSQSSTLVGECLNLEGISGVGGGSYEARFSTDMGNNSNWTFNNTAPTEALISMADQACFGDTVDISNNSTAFSNNINDLSFEFYITQPQPLDSAIIIIDSTTTYFIDTTGGTNSLDSALVIDTTVIIKYDLTSYTDTNQYVFPISGWNYVALTSEYTNFCTDSILDSIYINLPQVDYASNSLSNVICYGDSLSFELNSSTKSDSSDFTSIITFETFLNGTSVLGPGVDDTLYSSTTFNDGDSLFFRAYENGCPDTTNLSAIISVNPLPTVGLLSNDADSTICFSDSVSFIASGGDYFRFFNNGSPLTGLVHDTLGGDSLTINTLVDQDTLSVLTIIDSTGCRDTREMIFTVHPLPTTSLVSNVAGNVICDEQNVTFTASGADSYEFYVNGISQGAPSATNTFSTTSLAFSDTVSVMGYTNNGCSKKAPENFTYIVNPLPNVQMTFNDPDTSICSGTDVNFSVSGASQYEFFVNGVSQGAMSPTNTLSLNNLSNNDLIYAVGEFSGCNATSDTADFEVFISPTTTISSNIANDTICFGTQVDFTSSGANQYEWFINGNSQGAPSGTSNFSSTALANGNIVTVTGESNGCQVSQSIQYTVNPVPEVSLFSNDGDNELCDGDAIQFTSANATNFEWFINNTSQGVPSAMNTFSPSLPIGTNVVSVVGTNAFNCTDTIDTPISVEVYAVPTVTLTSSDGDNTICANEEVIFTASGSNQFQFFIDGNSTGAMSGTPTFTSSSLIDGQSITAWGSSNGCVSALTPSITMTVNAIPSVTLVGTDVDNVFCEGESHTFTANNATNYEFFVNTISQGPSSPVNNLDVSGYTNGTYQIQTVGNQAGCTDTTQVTLLINALPVVTTISSDADDIICENEQITLTASGANLYQFFVDGVAQGGVSPLNSYTNTINNGEVLSVEGTTVEGCSSTQTYGAITVTPLPTVALASSDANDSICVSEMVTFTGSGATEYEFFLDGISLGASSPIDNISIDSLSNGEAITVIGTQNNCQNTSTPISLSVFAYPVVNLTNNGDVEICDGEATDLVAMGSDNYTFLLDNVPAWPASNVNTFTNAVANGTVISVQGETNGCTTTAPETFTFVVNSYPNINVTSTDADNVICLDESVTLTASGAQTYQFNWNGTEVQNGATTSYSSDEILNGDAITVTGFNGDCPSAISTFNFTVNSMDLNLAASPSNMICAGEQVTFTGSGADQYSFLVNGTNVQAMGASNTYSSSSLNNLDSIQMIAQSNSTGCTQTWNNYILMNVIDQPIVSETGSTTFCEGDSVLLVSNNEFGNQWLLDGNPIAGATNDSLFVSESGAYSLQTTAGASYSIWSKGYNANGVVGNGNNFNLDSPEPANSSETFTQLSSGSNFILGLTNSNNVYAWGDNGLGQLGNGTFTAENEPIQVTTLTNISSVATTGESSVAVNNTGQVFVWGNNNDGQLALGSGAIVNFPTQNNLLSNIDTVVGGLNHFVFLNSTGQVFTAGNNNFGQLGDGSTTNSNSPVAVSGLPGIQFIGASEYSSFAMDSTGNLYVWGNNNNGQLGLNDLTNRLTPELSSLKNVNQADGGAEHSIFKTTGNEIYVSGGNTYGQLGTGNTSAVQVPTKIDMQGVAQVSASQYNSYFLRTDKTVSGTGYNVENQINASTQTSITSVVQIEGYDGVEFVEGGILSSHVISDESKSCESTTVNTIMETVTQATISESNEVLTASSGASYQWYLDGLPIPDENSPTIPLTAGGLYSVEVTYANGCSSLSDSYAHNVVGIDEKVTFNVSIYPNPTEGILNIQIGELNKVDIQIVDATGRTIYNKTLTDKNSQIDIQDLSLGVYSILLEHSGQRIIKRISKL